MIIRHFGPSRGVWVLSVLLICVLTAGNAAVLACERAGMRPEDSTQDNRIPARTDGKADASVLPDRTADETSHTREEETGFALKEEDGISPNRETEKESGEPGDGDAIIRAATDRNRNIVLPDSVSPAFCDVPLSQGQQLLALSEATRRSLPVSLVYGVMYAESRYTETAVSPDGVSYGIMQINRSNFGWLGETLGLTDFLDYEQNLKAGCYLLSLYYQKYGGNTDQILMCYRYGETGARRAWSNGVTTDAYCEAVRREQARLGG